MGPTGLENPRSRRAASLLLLLGTVELVLLAPVLALCLMVIRPAPAFEHQLEQKLTIDQRAWAAQTARMIAPLVTLLGVIPAAAFVALAKPVRHRRRGALLATRFLLLVQFIELLVLGTQRIPEAAQSLRDGLPVHLTANVLVIGTPILWVGYTFWRLGGLSSPDGESHP